MGESTISVYPLHVNGSQRQTVPNCDKCSGKVAAIKLVVDGETIFRCRDCYGFEEWPGRSRIMYDAEPAVSSLQGKLTLDL